jgi:hypothetical protein
MRQILATERRLKGDSMDAVTQRSTNAPANSIQNANTFSAKKATLVA